MATKTATRGAQRVLSAEFSFDITDTMVNTAGAGTSQAFSAAAGIFDVIKLPQNAVIVGGDLVVETASNDSSTATLKAGDDADDDRYLAATSIKSAARTALTLTGYKTDGSPIRITLANAGGDATVGTVRVRVEYVIQGKMDEVQTY
jgi:hypothetical protein